MAPDWLHNDTIMAAGVISMATLSIKNVPADIVEKLRERAARNHRSMQGELLALVTAASAAEAHYDGVSRRDGELPALIIAGGSGTHAGDAGAGAGGGSGSGDNSRPPRAGHTRKKGTKTIEEIMEAQRKRFPEPVTEGPLSVDMIRADRDAR